MKQYIISFILGLSLIINLFSCSRFEEINEDPNKPSVVTSRMLATKLILGVMLEEGVGKNFFRDDMLSKYIAWTEENDIDYLFNKLNRVDFFGGFYSYKQMAILSNVDPMIEYAIGEKQKNSYKALGAFIRVRKYFDLTMRVGDIPYSEAMQGDQDVFSPNYDSQREVLLGLLNELDQADRLFKEGETFEGDPVYNGDVERWRKAVNVMQLKILINLYKKEGDAELKLKERFREIVTNRPLFESNADNFQLLHTNKAGQKYPFYKDGNNYLVYTQMSSIVVEALKSYQDRRLFYYARPTPKAVEEKVEVNSWDAYQGVDPTLTFGEIQSAVESKQVSQINLRYSEIPEGEPTFLLSYGEMNFILAEAAVRGFIDGDAKGYYEKGITASMQFVSFHTPDNVDFHHNMKIDDDYIATYLQGEKVLFASETAQQIEQIIMQKYLSTFLQTPFNGYFEYRRTGIPDFPINPKSNRNVPADKMPLRWMYPQNEFNYNSKSVTEAVTRQYNGVDTENGVMWILQ